MINTAPLLAETVPQLAKELSSGLEALGEADLAQQVAGLKIVDRCRCGDDFCATIYTAPKPKGAYGAGHENVSLNAAEGKIILDVVDRKIVCVEVLYRDDIRQALLASRP